MQMSLRLKKQDFQVINTRKFRRRRKTFGNGFKSGAYVFKTQFGQEKRETSTHILMWIGENKDF